MSDPFAAALDALFNAPGSAAAVYVPLQGAPVAIRVIHSQPDASPTFQQMRTVQQANSFDVRKSEVPAPQPGDLIIKGAVLTDSFVDGGERFEILGDPMLDIEGMTWICGAAPHLA